MTDLLLFLAAAAVLSAVAFELARRLRVPLGAALLPAASSILLLHFAAALIGVLPWARAAGAATAIAIAVGALWRRRRRPDEPRVIVDPSAVVALLLAAGCWYRLAGQPYIYWDEFSHWGLLSKAIHGLDRLPQPGESVELLDYPPASALFHYFVLRPAEFTEGRSYAAQALLISCAWAAVVPRVSWRQAPIAISAWILACVLATVLTAGLASLYVDLVLASVFGGAFALAAFPRARGVRQLLLLAPVVAILPILKEVGWPLALLVAAVAAGSQLAPAVLTRHAAARSRTLAPAAAGALALATGLALAGYLPRASWQQHIHHGGVAATFPVEAGRSILDLPKAFLPTATTRESVTVARFREALWTRPVTDIARLPLLEAAWNYRRLGHFGSLSAREGPTTVIWAVLLTAVGIAAAALQPTPAERLRFAVAVVGLAAGCVAYLAGHLYAYLYAFSELEGTALASFGRYVGIYVLGAGLALIAAIVRAASAVESSRGRRGTAKGLLIAVGAGVATLAPVEAAFLVHGLRPSSPERAAIEPVLKLVRPYARTGERIYIVFQGSLGFEHRVARLEIAPAVANSSCWSLGAWYRQPDHWTCDYPPERVDGLLRAYTMLFLGHVDDKFWDQYGSLFPPGSERHRLYRIDTGGGGLRLTPVHPSPTR